MSKIKGLRDYLEQSSLKDVLEIPKEERVVCKELAQGEYNINYVFQHPVTKKKMVLRVNTGSQMHLFNQIQYEFDALEFLKESGRTPRPFYVDASKKLLDYGVMVMEFLEGRSLNYKTDLSLGAECLADIHSLPILGHKGFLSPPNPLQAILDECHTMVQTYYNSPLGNIKIKKQIEKMLKYGEEKLVSEGVYTGYHCCINTELNSGNFLINGYGKSNYLVDWEKPLLGNPVQDLGHFLAPTTTFWKTDIILSQKEIDEFVQAYLIAVDGRFLIENLKDQLELFISITCLRGITWCAMAWVQYQEPGRLIRNQNTFHKLEAYLDEDFLVHIERQYLKKI